MVVTRRSAVAIDWLILLSSCLSLADGRLSAIDPKWFEVGINRPTPCFPQGLQEEEYRFSWRKCCSGLFGDGGNRQCFLASQPEIYNYDRCCILRPEMGVEGLLPLHENLLKVGLSDDKVLLLHQDHGDGDHNTEEGVAVLYPGGYALARWADVCTPQVLRYGRAQGQKQLQVLELAAGVALPANVVRWRWHANATATEIQPRSLALLREVAHVEALQFKKYGSPPTLHAQHLDFMDRSAAHELSGRYDMVMSASIGCGPEQRAAAVGTAHAALRACGIAAFLECELKMRVIAASADELFGAGNRVLDDGPIPWDRKCDFRLAVWQKPMDDGSACSVWPWGAAKSAEPARPGCLD